MVDDLDSLAAELHDDPVGFADQLADAVASRHGDGPWLDALVERLSHHATTERSSRQLRHVLDVWDLSQSEFAGLLGVSRQAVTKWLDQALPAERAITVDDLSVATDLLVHHLKLERIPAVVRRPANALNGRSLMDLVASGDTHELVRATRAMFDPHAVHA